MKGGAAFALAVILGAWACASAGPRQVVLDQPARLLDGGLIVLFSDGAIAAPAVADEAECHADAGVFLELLSSRVCQSDADCGVFRHGLGAAELEVCYPVRVDVLQSPALIRERRNLARACGYVTIYSSTYCEHARCVDRRCELDDPSHRMEPK